MGALCRFAVTIRQQSAQTLGFGDGTSLVREPLIREGDQVIQPLVISFPLMILHVLPEHISQRPLPKRNQL